MRVQSENRRDTGYGTASRENSLTKKRLILAERENAVLKDENLQCKNDNRQLSARIEKLGADITALDERYKKDIALWESQNQALQQKNAVLAKESSEKIRELSELNRATESRLGGEISRLNDELRKLQELYAREREAVRNENARRELALSRRLKLLKGSRRTGRPKRLTQNGAFRDRTALRRDYESGREQGAQLKEREAEMQKLRERIDTLLKETAGTPSGK
jgi:hypothetical protein